MNKLGYTYHMQIRKPDGTFQPFECDNLDKNGECAGHAPIKRVHDDVTCDKYNEPVLPNEDDRCSLCGAELVPKSLHDSNITDDVYQYMLDDIQREVLRARNKMEDIVKHLYMHPTVARFGHTKAKELLEKMREVTHEIDDLPDLGSDDE